MSDRLAADRRSTPIWRRLRWAAALLIAGGIATPAPAAPEPRSICSSR